jgi:hypothetical protein
MGALALCTSLLVIGIFFGVAAVVFGVVARLRALSGVTKPATAAVGIALGVVAIAVGVGVLVVFWPYLEQLYTGDPCHPVKQHAGCY